MIEFLDEDDFMDDLMKPEESLEEKNKKYNELKEQLKKAEEEIKEYEEEISNLSEEITLLEAKKIRIKRGKEDGKIEDVDKEIEKIKEETEKKEEELEAQKAELDKVKGKIEDIINEVKSNPVAKACIDEMVRKQFERRLKKQQDERTVLESKRNQLKYLKNLIDNPKEGGNYLIGIISATKSIEELNKIASESTPIEPPVLPVPEEKPKWYQFIKRFRKWNKERTGESSDKGTVKNREIAEKITQEKERLEKNKAYLKKHLEKSAINEEEINALIEEICSSKDGKIKPEEISSIIESKLNKTNKTIKNLDKVMEKNARAIDILHYELEYDYEPSSRKEKFMKDIAINRTVMKEGGIMADTVEKRRREVGKMARKGYRDDGSEPDDDSEPFDPDRF